MAKRFTDNNKWKKRWFKELPMQYKLLWIYILDDCDHAGIWEVDLDVAEIRIHPTPDGKVSFLQNECEDIFADQIVVLKEHNHKWFIPDFITFQYGKLNPSSRVHQSVIQILEKYNLYEPAKELEYIEVKEVKKFSKPTVEEVHEYCNERKNKVCADSFINFYESKGWKIGKSPMKCWKSAVRTWEKNDFNKPKSNKIDKNLSTWQNVRNLIK
jgi:Ni/Co efflux regulator RcnB